MGNDVWITFGGFAKTKGFQKHTEVPFLVYVQLGRWHHSRDDQVNTLDFWSTWRFSLRRQNWDLCIKSHPSREDSSYKSRKTVELASCCNCTTRLSGRPVRSEIQQGNPEVAELPSSLSNMLRVWNVKVVGINQRCTIWLVFITAFIHFSCPQPWAISLCD